MTLKELIMNHKDKVNKFINRFGLELPEESDYVKPDDGSHLQYINSEWIDSKVLDPVNGQAKVIFYEEESEAGAYQVYVTYIKNNDELDLESHLYQFEKDKENGTLAES